MRVLVTEDAPGYGVLAALRGLAAAGWEPWLAVTRRGAYGARSRASAGTIQVADPALEPERYVDDLAAASRRIGAVAVLPGTETAMLAIAGRGERFDSSVAIGACPPETVRRATDKLQLGRIASAVGISSAPTRTIRSEDLAGDVGLSFPAVVKPVRTSTPTAAGKVVTAPVRRVETIDELRAAVADLPGDRWLVQPYVNGALGAVCGVAWKGQLVCASHQVAQRIYPPDCGISAYAATVARDEELEQRVAAMMAALDWSGLFQAQFMHAGEQRYLIDLNPRVYGSLALAIGAGLNLPAIWAELLAGRAPRTGAYRVGVRFRSEERDAGALAAAIGARRWRDALSVLVPRRNTVHAVFSLRDPRPSLYGLRRLARARDMIERGHRR